MRRRSAMIEIGEIDPGTAFELSITSPPDSLTKSHTKTGGK